VVVEPQIFVAAHAAQPLASLVMHGARLVIESARGPAVMQGWVGSALAAVGGRLGRGAGLADLARETGEPQVVMCSWADEPGDADYVRIEYVPQGPDSVRADVFAIAVPRPMPVCAPTSLASEDVIALDTIRAATRQAVGDVLRPMIRQMAEYHRRSQARQARPQRLPQPPTQRLARSPRRSRA
jgi:hypothetical protein